MLKIICFILIGVCNKNLKNKKITNITNLLNFLKQISKIVSVSSFGGSAVVEGNVIKVIQGSGTC